MLHNKVENEKLQPASCNFSGIIFNQVVDFFQPYNFNFDILISNFKIYGLRILTNKYAIFSRVVVKSQPPNFKISTNQFKNYNQLISNRKSIGLKKLPYHQRLFQLLVSIHQPIPMKKTTEIVDIFQPNLVEILKLNKNKH